MNNLIPPVLLSDLPDFYETENTLDPICHFKLFTADANWTWYIIEFSKEDRICFGYVVGHEAELGYFSLDELASIRGPLGLAIERDLSFKPTPFSKIKMDKHENR